MKYIKVLFVLVLLLNIAGCSKKEEKKEETKEENITETSEPIYCEITVKDYGKMKLELYPDIAPLTVENFVKLVKDGFYTDNRFHRIIDGFMIQGGMDTSGSVERIKGEFLSNGIVNDLKHTERVISMARAKDPDSASSQFFIMVGDGSWLDGEYAAFGKVIEGYEVALQIAKDAKPIDNNGSIAQEDMPVIESIVIVEK